MTDEVYEYQQSMQEQARTTNKRRMKRKSIKTLG